ncbi:hypothetical protein J2X45_001070 [Caulobacter sp. BE264]|uniref:hypothetical protein n=1 Tax=Caulobacter sp. BE264 TaxID=2817724 RepID=UPI00285C5716|nr:hypothetical protein [Caulobacter sp. BE264]MDR7229989.1 hypothetical protein [Caulobacter sp. BE264]
MTIKVKKRERPDVAAFGRKITEKYPTVLTHLAEMERQEKLERTDETGCEETLEGPKS